MDNEEKNNASVEDALSGKRIMWVEDDTTLSDIMDRWLKRYNIKVYRTTSGSEALEMVRKAKPDILLLDILLPDINGFEVLESIKSDDYLKDIPVILFSNLNHKEDIDKGYKLGASRFMVKSTTFLENLAKEIVGVLQESGKL